MKMGLAIARRREELGMTQDELAKAVGVNKATICRWESGDISNMRRDRIQKLASALQVSPTALLDEETDGLFSGIKNNAPDDEVRSDIICMVGRLSDSQARQLRDFLSGMLSE